MGDERRSLLNAVGFLEQATRRDAKFARAYCLLARSHDALYSLDFDKTPERRALGDAAVNEALRLGPDLPEAHLAAAFHFSKCYRNYERSRVQIAIAQRALPHSPESLALAAYLDGQQGRWEESTRGLKKAVGLDPRNPELLSHLAGNYLCLRLYRDAEQTYDRLIAVEPDKPIFEARKAYARFVGRGDLTGYSAVLEKLPPSLYNSFTRIYVAVCARDWPVAKEILTNNSYEDLPFYVSGAMMIPRGCVEIWLAYIRGDHPRMEAGFAAAHEQLKRKVEAHPEDAQLLSALGMIDAALGRKEDAIQEAKRALTMPSCYEHRTGVLAESLATVYAWTNEPDLAFQELAVSIKTPDGANYGELKLDPSWDPLRNDARFDKLLADIAPRG